MKEKIEERLSEIENKLQNLTLIEAMLKLYHQMLNVEGPENYSKVLEKTDLMLWNEIGKETFSEIKITEILDAVMLLVFELVAGFDSKFDDLVKTLQQKKKNENVDEAKLNHAMAVLMLVPSQKFMREHPEARDSLSEILTSGGKMLTGAILENAANLKDFHKEVLLPYYTERSMAEAAMAGMAEAKDQMQKKEQVLKKKINEPGNTGETGSDTKVP